MGEAQRKPIQLQESVKKRNIYTQNVGDVKRLINNTINELRNGDIDSKTANAVGYLANILLKVFETEEVVQRITRIEQQMDLILQHTHVGS